MVSVKFFCESGKQVTARKVFLDNESKWLDGICTFPKFIHHRQGRPEANFSHTSESSKRRKVKDLREEYSTEELLYAAQMNLRSEGKIIEADIVKNALSPSFEDKCRQAFPPVTQQISTSDSVTMIADAKLTKNQYNIIRSYSGNIFPPYKAVQKEKSESYPSNIKVTETIGEVPLQDLLDHTTKRIIENTEIQSEVTKLDLNANKRKLTLYTKWEFDGSSGHSEYKQKFAENSCSDKFVFISCILPLQLTIEDEYEKKQIWKNSKSSSTRFCRPLRIQFQKESDDLIKSEKEKTNDEIKNMLPTTVRIEKSDYTVEHRLIFCMIDGKICNTLTDTKSALRCYLCDKSSKDLNDVNQMKMTKVNENYLEFGMSLLHAWIRMFELLLHIAYKLPVKQWRSKCQIVSENKKRIQREFRARTGLIIDLPKPGFGNSNDGNVARIFFQNAQVASEITGIDYNLIKRFYIILQVMSSGEEIDTEKFKNYCLETAELYTSLYNWYYMSTTVHKILIHGHNIIQEAPLPIVQLSEEAQEARNKDFKFYREHLSSKTSRKDTLTDIMQRMLLTSDPYISIQHQKDNKSNKLILDPEVEILLLRTQ